MVQSDLTGAHGAQGHIHIMEQGEANQQALLAGLEYLLNISFVRDDEILKICLDFWHFFVPDVYNSVAGGTGAANLNAAPLLTPTQASLPKLMRSRWPHTRCMVHQCCITGATGVHARLLCCPDGS